MRGDEKADEFCETTSHVARGAMNAAMVGLRRRRDCNGHTLMPFVAVTDVAYNVFGFTKAREPTARAAKGFSPPFTEADYPARGDKRPQAAPREPGVS
jgi:hypothetical protein